MQSDSGDHAEEVNETPPEKANEISPEDRGEVSKVGNTDRGLIGVGAVAIIFLLLFLFFHVVVYDGGLTLVAKQTPNLAMPVVFVSKLIEEWNSLDIAHRLRLMTNENYSHLINELERRGIIKMEE